MYMKHADVICKRHLMFWLTQGTLKGGQAEASHLEQLEEQ